MRNLLVPVVPHAGLASVLTAAVLTARRFEGTIEGFGLRPALAEYVPVDMVGGLTWVRDEEHDREAAGRAGEDFAAFMEEHGVPRRGAGGAPQGTGGPGFVWRADAPPGEIFLGQHGRLFNATIVGRPGSGEGQPRMTTLEAALFESGRPILIAPPKPPATLGDTVVVAWNGSSETAGTVAFGAPFLRRASRVVVVEVEGGLVPGPSAAALAAALAREGIAAQARSVAPGRRTTGETFLAEAEALGCDLLIKGAYTQSRLRQMIFGGATNHILSAATMPVLMSH